MSMMAVVHPVPHSTFKREFPWDDNRPRPTPVEYPARPQPVTERIALPSIRQMIPELALSPQDNAPSAGPPPQAVRSPLSASSPVAVGYGNGNGGAMTPPEYVHSPDGSNKRRRVSIGDENEERERRVPRLYSPPGSIGSLVMGPHRTLSPPTTAGSRSVTDSWASSDRTSPTYAQAAGNNTMPHRSPLPMEVSERQEPPRPTLPSLPRLNLNGHEPLPMPRTRGHSSDDYSHAPRPAVHMHHQSGPSMDMRMGPQAYRQPQQHQQQQQQQQHQQQGNGAGGYPYGYHHPMRAQSMSMGPSTHHLDHRTPFSAGPYSHHYYHDYPRPYEMVGMNGDNKQRKRRGNLPKETTDKLRQWFHANLHHPYPTEDEKQELMRQTGLQMNQISNWFINARRRQLPIFKLAEAQQAMQQQQQQQQHNGSNNSINGNGLPSSEGERHSAPLSDGDEISSYGDDNMGRRIVSNNHRGSV